MTCSNPLCRTKNPRHATHCARCGEPLPAGGARWTAFSGTSLGCLLIAAVVYLNFGGIYFAFSRHGTEHGIMAIFLPPYAWYRAVSPLWDTPKWQREALDKVESVAYVVLNAQSGDGTVRAEMAERIPGLRRLYQQQSPEFRTSLDRSLTAFVELIDAMGHDMLDEIVRRGTVTIDRAAVIRRHQTLYDSAGRYEGLRAAIEATMLDAEYVRSMFSLTDTKDVPVEAQASILNQAESSFKRWKEGAIQTKDRILR